MQPPGDSQLSFVSFRERYGTSYGRGIALPISGSAKGWTTSGTCRETCCQEVCANTVWTLCELWAEWSDWRFLFLLLCSVPSNGIVAACSFSLVDKKSALLNFCICLPFLYLPLSLCFVIQGSNLSATFFCCWVFGRLCMYVAEFPSLLHIPGWPRVISDAYSDKEFLDANLLACMICEHVQVSNPFVKYMVWICGVCEGIPNWANTVAPICGHPWCMSSWPMKEGRAAQRLRSWCGTSQTTTPGARDDMVTPCAVECNFRLCLFLEYPWISSNII